MPAVSKAQQRFFGLVKSMQKGDTPKEGEAGKVAKTMNKDDVDDFASTKHKGKPEKVKREQRVKHLIKKMVREKYDSGLSDLFYQQNDMEQAAILAKYGNEGQKKELKKALEKRLSGDVEGFKKGIRNVQTMSATDSDSINTTTDDTNVTTGKKSSNLLLPAALVGAGGLGLKAMSDKKKKKEKDMNEEDSTQDKVLDKLDKAIKFTKENPGKVTAGIAGTALAGLGLSKLMKKKKKRKNEMVQNVKTMINENPVSMLPTKDYDTFKRNVDFIKGMSSYGPESDLPYDQRKKKVDQRFKKGYDALMKNKDAQNQVMQGAMSTPEFQKGDVDVRDFVRSAGYAKKYFKGENIKKIGENSMKKTENTNESSKKEKKNKALKTAATLAAIGGGGYAADKAGLFDPIKLLYKGFKIKGGKLVPPSPYQPLPGEYKTNENLTLNVRNLISEQVATNENVRNMLSEKILKKLAKLATLGLAGYGAYKGFKDFQGLGDTNKARFNVLKTKLKDLNPFKKKAEESHCMNDDEEKEESNCG